eukprot:TRINITY_DN10104_c0_g2_i2.p1 TRINITY_DN10104_c0_g2~~TRINITY_DN10104_c0_g2_i2.p1  ORF type:complete len:1319 (+),score=352.23 TRINITY_DN10104_c0_g2_i2:102-4058(+)
MASALTPKPPGGRGRPGGRERYYDTSPSCARAPAPPPRADGDAAPHGRWGLVAVRSEWMEVSAGADLLAAGDRLLAEALRVRAATGMEEEHARRGLRRVVAAGEAAAVPRREEADVRRFERTLLLEEHARDGVEEDEEHHRTLIFLHVLRGFESDSTPAMPPALLTSRRLSAAVADAARAEEAARQAVEVDASAEWARLGFQAEHSVHFIERLTPAVRRERDLIVEREVSCRAAVAGHWDVDLDDLLNTLRPDYVNAQRKTRMLPVTHFVVRGEAAARAAVKTEWVLALSATSEQMVADRGDWMEALQNEEDHTRHTLMDTEHDAVTRVVDAHDYLPRCTGVPADEAEPYTEFDRLRHELFSLEDCYRLVWREKEAAGWANFVHCEKDERDRCNKKLRESRIVPPHVAAMIYEVSLKRQTVTSEEAKGWTSLILDFHVSTAAVAFRRLTEATLRPAAALAPPRADAVRAVASQAAAFATEMRAKAAGVAKEFEAHSAQAVEDMAMKNGLTHGWDVLLNIAWQARLRLQAECEYTVLEMAHGIAIANSPVAALCMQEEEEAVARAVEAVPAHLQPMHTARCEEMDRRRDAAFQEQMHLLVAYARAAHAAQHEHAAALAVEVRGWALEGRRLSIIHGRDTEWVQYALRRGAQEAEHGDAVVAESLGHMEAVVRECCLGWNDGVGAWCRDTVAMEVAWCDHEQRVASGGSCVAMELARARVEERASVRVTRAHVVVLLQEARIEASLIDDGVAEPLLAHSDEQTRWLEDGLAMIDCEYAHDPHLQRAWASHLRAYQQTGLYLLRRHALLALAASDKELADAAAAVHAAAHEVHLDAAFEVLDSALLEDLIGRGEAWLAVDRGSDEGGRALTCLRLEKAELKARAALLDDATAAHGHLLYRLHHPAPAVMSAVSAALVGKTHVVCELTAEYAPPAPGADADGALVTVGDADVDAVCRALAHEGLGAAPAFVTVQGDDDLRLRRVSVLHRCRVAAAAAAARAEYETWGGLCVWVSSSLPACNGAYRRTGRNTLRQAGGDHALRKVAARWELIELPYHVSYDEDEVGGVTTLPHHCDATATPLAKHYERCWFTHNTQPVYLATDGEALYQQHDGRWAAVAAQDPASGALLRPTAFFGAPVILSKRVGSEVRAADPAHAGCWAAPAASPPICLRPGSSDADRAAGVGYEEAIVVLRALARPGCCPTAHSGGVLDAAPPRPCPPAVRGPSTGPSVNDGVQVHSQTLAVEKHLFGRWALCDPSPLVGTASSHVTAKLRWMDVVLLDYAECHTPWFATTRAQGVLAAMDGAAMEPWHVSAAAARDFTK